MSTITGLSAFSLYFSTSTMMTLVLSSMFVAAGSVMINNMLAIIVDLFPTTLRSEKMVFLKFYSFQNWFSRTMTVALAMMSGRTGAVIGNALYPLLLQSGCAAPFIYNGVLSLSKYL